jgi:phage tail sheath protein FI
MAEYLSPGLFLSERKASAGPVQSVSTSTYATVGWLQKGPENVPQLITSFARFVSIFGSYWRNSYIPYMMAGFFQNQGARAYITRVTPSDASKSTNASSLDDAATSAEFIGKTLAATVDLSTNSYIAITIDAGTKHEIDCVGSTPAATTPAEIQGAISTAIGAEGTCTVDSDRIRIVSATTGASSSVKIEEAASNDATPTILGFPVSAAETYTYTGKAASDWTVDARWKGAWYNLVRVCISGNIDYEDDNGGYTRFDVVIEAESALGEGDWETLETYTAVVLDDDTSDYFIEDSVNDNTEYAQFTAGTDYGIPRALMPTYNLAEWLDDGDGALVTFSGTLRNPTVQSGTLEIVAGAITATDNGDGTLSGTGVTSATIDYTTGAWSITYAVAPTGGVPIISNYYTAATSEEVCAKLAGGTDGTGPLTRGDVTDPVLQASKLGLYSFDTLDEILNISMPDFAGNTTVTNDLISYAENSNPKNRFVICTTPIGTTPTDAKKFVTTTAKYNTSFAALYYPWVKIYDPISDDGRTVTVPPDGFIAGVYARTDITRNVGKTPAGLTDGKINGIEDLERVLDKGDRDILYPVRINPIASSVQTGLAVWGGRTLSKDAEWLNVNARRLFMFCEQSLYNASFWVPFENNGPGLWSRMKKQGEGFLLRLFRDNYFKGKTPDEAYVVICDESNNTTEEQDAGFVTIDYYLAPGKPAEFVRLRFQQKVD